MKGMLSTGCEHNGFHTFHTLLCLRTCAGVRTHAHTRGCVRVCTRARPLPNHSGMEGMEGMEG